jgi:pimeloyl-ACP methyl ester carboxylesterase
MRDPASGECLGRCPGVFERADVVELPAVGHAPPEERGPELAPVIARFLSG